jgi:hypothetical protein
MAGRRRFLSMATDGTTALATKQGTSCGKNSTALN